MHRAAWQRAQNFLDHLHAVPQTVVRTTLAQVPIQQSRRNMMKRMAWLPLIPLIVWLGGAQAPREDAASMLKTRPGEQKRVVLADGSTIILNTASTLEVLYSDKHRKLRLHEGEVAIETAADPLATGLRPSRPFSVDTRDGSVTALGTVFTVRSDATPGGARLALHSEVAVFEGAVEIRAAGRTHRLNTHEKADFSRQGISTPVVADEAVDGAWRTGMLIAHRMPLASFANELERYQSLTLESSAEVADLRVSGAFPVLELERSLHLLSQSFPVRVTYLSHDHLRLDPK